MRLLKSIFVSGTVLLCSFSGYSQQVIGGTAPDSKMIGASAGASPGGMGGLYTPNLYDGTVNVNIPIYQYSAESGQYGISLSYNTRGVRVDEIASPVGLHWTLNAEGMIQRVVKGLPDELNLTYNDTIWTSGVTKYNRFRGRLASSFDAGAEATDPMVYRDQESDDFLVSVGGLSFTFNIGTGRAIYTNPDRKYRVDIQSNGQPYATVVQQTGTQPNPQTIEFLITDPAGNKYHFKKGDYDYSQMFADMDASINQGFLGDYSAITRWVVDKITLANGKTITYSYYDKTGAASIYKSYATGVTGGSTPVGASFVNKGDNFSLIKAINYPNGVTANFVYDTTRARCDYGNEFYSQNSMALREIRISSGGNCTRYQMDQSYTVVRYGGNNTGEIPYGSNCVSITNIPSNRSHRLRLKGISQTSCDGTFSEPLYTFTYESVELPLRFSGSQDWFGYYNGKVPVPYNTSQPDPDLTIPLHTEGTKTFGVNRDPDFVYMRAGILTSIRNATGGSALFSYGPHDIAISNPLGSFTPGPANAFYFGPNASDGLRVNSITESDIYHLSNLNTTTFTYLEGQRFFNGGFFHYPADIAYVNTGTPGKGIITSNYVTPHQLIAGANHGYSRVMVTTTGSTNEQLSKKEIRFTNLSDSLSGFQPRYSRAGGGKHFFEFPYTDKQYIRDWEMGLPLYILNYDQYGNILEKTVNSYSFSIDTVTAVASGVQGIKSSFVRDASLPPAPQSSLFNFTIPRRAITDPYKPYTGEAQLIATTTYKYLSNTSFVTDKVTYEYDNYKNLKATTTYNSSGEEVKLINYYNYDIAVSMGGTFFTPLFGLQKVVGTQRWKRIPGNSGDLPGGGVLLDGFFNAYVAQGSGSLSNIWVKNAYNLRTGTPLTYTQYLGTGAYNTTDKKVQAVFEGTAIPDFRKTSEVLLFDAKGNPLETQLVSQSLYKAMIWDTTTGQKLAEAANCRYKDIAYSGFEATVKGNWNYNAADIVASSSLSGGGIDGKKVLKALSVNASPLSVTGLTTGTEYIITFWCKGGTPVLSGGGIANIPITVLYNRGNGWLFYQARFTPINTSAVGLIKTGTPSSPFAYYIDDIRLFPASATMQSWTYEPLFGTSSETDATGRITYYEYDGLGRQIVARDQEGNILSKKQFTVNGNQ